MFKLLYFSAPWCGPCKMTGPAIKSVSSYYNIPIEEVDCSNEKNDNLVTKFNVLSTPTIILLDETVEVYRAQGLKNVEILKSELKEYIL